MAEKQLMAELEEDGQDIEDLMTEIETMGGEEDDEWDDEELQLEGGPMDTWNKGICM